MSGSLSGLLSTVTKTRYYFNPETSSCEEYQLGRCGGNSNSFESKMLCTATCLKVQVDYFCDKSLITVLIFNREVNGIIVDFLTKLETCRSEFNQLSP